MFRKLRRRLFRTRAGDAGHLAAQLVQRAGAAAAEERFADAAALYGEALRLQPSQPRIYVQAGHMAKEAGDLDAAERYYRTAADALPQDADLALQLGHFYKISGRLREAERSYRRALSLRPGWEDPLGEIAHLEHLGWHGRSEAEGRPTERGFVDAAAAEATSPAILQAGIAGHLVPDLLPRSRSALLHRNGESIHLRRLGRRDQGAWGMRQTLRGVEAIRGFCISAEPIVELQILLNGQMIHRGPVQPFPVVNEAENFELRKYVFNVWLDFSDFLPGRYHIELYFRDRFGTSDEQGGRRSHRDYVVIRTPLQEPVTEGGDAWTPPTDPADPRSIDDQINARPSLIRRAERAVIGAPVRNLLVLRTDQLGDVVASVPSFKRLRELFPNANIVCLATAANADLIRTLKLVDEVIVVPFPDDPIQRRRVMLAEDQDALRRRLEPYRFDLAVDLAPAGESRPLLLLSGARFLVGMGGGAWPWLSAAFDFNTHDAIGRSDVIAHSSKTLAMVESLRLLQGSPAQVVRRADLDRSRLTAFGIAAHDRFAVLHTGARVVASRWPHYPELARRLLDADQDLKLVMLSEESGARAALPSELFDHPRFQLLDQRLAFDDFDALLSFCTLFVGNDSGPKHLASLRGAKVVSLHLARVNWGEWGQELGGVIISRQVPCAACHIYHDPDECGKDFACITHVAVDEVLGACLELLRGTGAGVGSPALDPVGA